ncbi:hypothetical protein E2C01_084377 [Portunus trituberculatus]|uniref:Uncharacterized protein n=1 Tax=Portunus trituberculatus TaxID=210409 RepID=A0A5B7IV50_PORTR|nr:hypothetical protein [Portunus trituberculatus]
MEGRTGVTLNTAVRREELGLGRREKEEKVKGREEEEEEEEEEKNVKDIQERGKKRAEGKSPVKKNMYLILCGGNKLSGS